MGLLSMFPSGFRQTFEPKVEELGKNEIVAIRDGQYTPTVAVDQAQDLIESGYDFSVLFILTRRWQLR